MFVGVGLGALCCLRSVCWVWFFACSAFLLLLPCFLVERAGSRLFLLRLSNSVRDSLGARARFRMRLAPLFECSNFPSRAAVVQRPVRRSLQQRVVFVVGSKTSSRNETSSSAWLTYPLPLLPPFLPSLPPSRSPLLHAMPCQCK